MPVSLFKKKVRDVTKEAVATVKEAAAKVTTEKMDVWGDAAKIGTFAIMAFGAMKAFGEDDRKRRKRQDEDPVVRTITVNNYYYRQPNDRYQRRKKA